jgi:hypothetical protein
MSDTVFKVGLDVDGVLACFTCGVLKRAKEMGLEKDFAANCNEVNYWDMSDSFSTVMKDAWLDPQFWLALPNRLDPLLPFLPHCYITSRPIDTAVTKQWLDSVGFPEAPIITVKNPVDKIQHIKDLELDVFVDDHYVTVTEGRKHGLNMLLWKAPYQVGHQEECCNLPTITTMEEVENYV